MKELQDVQAELERLYDEALNGRMSWADAQSAAGILGEIAKLMQARAAKAGRTSRRRGSFDQADPPASGPFVVTCKRDESPEAALVRVRAAARQLGADLDSMENGVTVFLPEKEGPVVEEVACEG